MSQLPNGDWVIEKTVVSNDDPNSGWNVSFTLTDGMDFDTWSWDFPTSYKQDCENILDDQENWTYWFLSEGTLTGWAAMPAASRPARTSRPTSSTVSDRTRRQQHERAPRIQRLVHLHRNA